MRLDGKWTRRSLLGAAVAAVGAGMYVSTNWRSRGGSRSRPETGGTFRELLLRTVAGLDIPCNSGEVFLSTEAGGERERDIQGLVASLEDTLGANGHPEEGDRPEGWLDMDADGLARLLSEAVKEDFSKDELCIVDGWQLSRTECRLAALKFLRERDQAAGGAMACRKEPLRPTAPPPQLSEIVPPRTFVGVPFTIQPNGQSVINVYGTGFEPGAEILLGGTPLHSSVGRPDWMNAYVPADFYAREGILDIAVRNPDGKTSNVMKFEVVRRNE